MLEQAEQTWRVVICHTTSYHGNVDTCGSIGLTVDGEGRAATDTLWQCRI